MTRVRDVLRGCLRVGPVPMTSRGIEAIRLGGYRGVFNLTELPLAHLHAGTSLHDLDVEDHAIGEAWAPGGAWAAGDGWLEPGPWTDAVDMGTRRRFIKAVRGLSDRIAQGHPTRICVRQPAVGAAVGVAAACRLWDLAPHDVPDILDAIAPGTPPDATTIQAVAWTLRLP